MISRARIKSFPGVLWHSLKAIPKIFRTFGFKVGLSQLYRVVFEDVTNRQYDFQGELRSQRNGLNLLLTEIGNKAISIEYYLQTEFHQVADTNEISRLQHSLITFGSDKGHDSGQLYMLYANIICRLREQKEQVRLLEIGLGTNNVDIESNMGVFGSPGASLRAFRDFLRPQDLVFGADIDSRILFQEKGISTYFVDQLKPVTISSLAKVIGSADVIIDDGLHILESNMNTVLILLPILTKGGYYVVEDISNLPENVLAWSLFSTHLSGLGFESALIRSPSGSLGFLIKK